MSSVKGEGLADRYAFAGGAAGKQRLDVVSAVMHEQTTAVLDRAGVTEGQRCLDVGCGGGHVTRTLAGRVGPTGRVVGVDLDADVLQLASNDAAAAGHTNVEFRQGDVADLADGSYDVGYARFLLSHLADPGVALAGLARVVVPGGTVITEDIDASASFCHPYSPVFHRAVTLFRDAVRHRGGNPDIGPSLPSLLAGAGLRDVAVTVHQPAGVGGDVKDVVLLDLRRSAAAIVAAGLATEAEIVELTADLTAYVTEPGTLVSLQRIVQVWARMP